MEPQYTWEKALARFIELSHGTYVAKSDYRGLELVFRKAKEWGLDPIYARHACLAPFSNLRAGVSEMRRAVRWEDPKALADIIEKCATLPNTELRLALHTVYVENVPAVEVDDRFLVDLSQAQFAELQHAMRLRHHYSVTPQPRVEPALNAYDIYQ